MDRKADAAISSELRLGRGPKWQQPKPDGAGRRMAEPTADPAFVKQVQDVGEQLVDAIWSPSEYEYAVVELPATLDAARAARKWATAALVTRSLEETERDDVM